MNCKENAENWDKMVDEQAWRGHKKRTGLHRRSMRNLGKMLRGRFSHRWENIKLNPKGLS
jgi:hypothetical protein